MTDKYLQTSVKNYKYTCSICLQEKRGKTISDICYSCRKKEEDKTKLKQFLDSSCSNKVHLSKIMNLPTLKEAHMYCKYNYLSGQTTGPAIENYIREKYKMKKNKIYYFKIWRLCTWND